MTPDLDDDVFEVHTNCPFCKGEYVMTAETIRHSYPACDAFERSDPHAFVMKARAKEAQQVASAKG